MSAEEMKDPFVRMWAGVQLLRRQIQEKRASLAEGGVWLTARQEQIPIVKLTDAHLLNIIAMYERRASPFDFPGLAERMVRPLLREAERRALKSFNGEARDRFLLIEIE